MRPEHCFEQATIVGHLYQCRRGFYKDFLNIMTIESEGVKGGEG
jgi:hypothetical protein